METKVPAVGTLTKQKCRCHKHLRPRLLLLLEEAAELKDMGVQKLAQPYRREGKDPRGPTSECPVSLSPWPCHL